MAAEAALAATAVAAVYAPSAAEHDGFFPPPEGAQHALHPLPEAGQDSLLGDASHALPEQHDLPALLAQQALYALPADGRVGDEPPPGSTLPGAEHVGHVVDRGVPPGGALPALPAFPAPHAVHAMHALPVAAHAGLGPQPEAPGAPPVKLSASARRRAGRMNAAATAAAAAAAAAKARQEADPNYGRRVLKAAAVKKCQKALAGARAAEAAEAGRQAAAAAVVQVQAKCLFLLLIESLVWELNSTFQRLR